MRLCERLLVLLAILLSALGENKTETKRKGRHLLALLGYLHGYKIGQDYSLQIPSTYLIAPIIVLPSVNQQQSVSFQNGNADENYQENGDIVQSISSAKIVSNTSTEDIAENNIQNNDDTQEFKTVQTDIEVPTLRQGVSNNNSVDNSTEISEVPENNSTIPEQETNATTNGPYPSATYDNKMINSLSLTTITPLGQSQDLPPISDNRWKNFTLKANLGDIMSDDNTTTINEMHNSTVAPSFSSENLTEHHGGTLNTGPYPNSWYNNTAIDQLSITTNYYTNESPLPQSDRWGSYSPMNKITLPSGFRPLAGLYYDGFLHRPLKKYGFVPQNYWN